MGHPDGAGKAGTTKSNGSTGSQTGSGYSTDVSDDNLPPDVVSPNSDANEHSESDEQVRPRGRKRRNDALNRTTSRKCLLSPFIN